MVQGSDIGWVAGLFDGEGSIFLKPRLRFPPQVNITIVNTEKDLLVKAQSILDELEIDSSLLLSRSGKDGRKPLFKIQISNGPSVRRFFAKLPIHSPAKLARYEELRSFIPSRSRAHSTRHTRLARQYSTLL